MESWVLDKIRRAKAERWRFLDLGKAGLTELPPELFELDQLEGLNLSDSYFNIEADEWQDSKNEGASNAIAVWPKTIAQLVSLTNLIAWGQPFSDVEPLAKLANLNSLDLNSTQVSDVEPLAKLANLNSLNLRYTQVSDVEPLAKLANLNSLNLSSTQVSDVEPLAKLVNLNSLYLSSTQVSDIEPLANLANLNSLNLSDTQVSDVEPLAKLANLNSLNLSFTQVSDVEPLAKLANLYSLDLSDTQVSDVEPLANLANLNSLYLSYTQVTDVEPLAKLANLNSLHLAHCQLRVFPQIVFALPILEYLYLFGNPIGDCPAEVFEAQFPGCLSAARTHFADQAAGKVADRELKLILLGNGRVGKSSIAKRLIHNTFDPHEESTHAIRLEEWTLDMAAGETRINVWDFGGQDIYHGTHALFLKSRAVFVIVWDRITEQKPNYEADGLTFENLPLAYWLGYVRAVSPHAAVIVVENKCDDGHASTPTSELGGLPLVHFSAEQGHGRELLMAHIKEAAQRVLGQAASHEIGIGRWAVKQTLRGYQRSDKDRPSHEQQYCRITRQHFEELCAAQGEKISSSDELLKFLHNSGVLYHEPNLFHGDIILDQRWAIRAIYTLFDRKRCYRQLLKKHGRFTLNDLHDLAWDEAGYSPDEQRLFLSFMQSCSLCFRLSEHRQNEDPNEVIYLAPELLPERETLQDQIHLRTRLYDNVALPLRDRKAEPQSTPSPHSAGVAHSKTATPIGELGWGIGSLWFRYRHRFWHQGIMQRFLVRIGELFRETALYWKDGVLLESSKHRALAEITCQRKLDGNPARGAILLNVRGQGREALLNELRNELERLHDSGTEVDQHASLDGTEWIDLSKLSDGLIVGKIVSDKHRAIDAAPFRFLQHRNQDDRLTGPYEPSSGRDDSKLVRPIEERHIGRSSQRLPVYISYCRRDDRTRVDHLYETLKADGYDVRRDEESIEYKGRISDFMEELGRGACVVAVISDNYLRSPFCMWELNFIYRQARSESEFIERLCPIVLADANLFEPHNPLLYAVFWKNRLQELNEEITRSVEIVSGDGTVKKRDRIREIVHDADKVLGLIADMNCEDPSLLEEQNFAQLKAAINKRLATLLTPTPTPASNLP